VTLVDPQNPTSAEQVAIGEAVAEITTQVLLLNLCDDIVGGTYDRQP